MFKDWHPRPAPTVRLFLKEEATYVPFLGVPVIHELLYEILRPHIPDVLTERCSSHPKARLIVGERYLALSVPPLHTVSVYHPLSTLWQCVGGRRPGEGCKRWIVTRGSGGMRGQYTVVSEAQDQEAVFFDQQTWHVIVTGALRAQIDEIGLTDVGWESIIVCDKPRPEHVEPGAGTG